jgi:hypothetical protein
MKRFIKEKVSVKIKLCKASVFALASLSLSLLGEEKSNLPEVMSVGAAN